MNKNYINRIIDGDPKAFDEMYYACKNNFVNGFRSNFGTDKERSEDLYHKAIAILNNNIETGRIKTDDLPDEKLQAYIFKSGKYIMFNENRKRQVGLTFDTDAIMNDSCMDDEEYDREKDDKLFIVKATVRDMPMPCSKLLSLAVYHKKSNAEIARIMDYSGPDSVKTQRYRCMQRLRDMVVKRFKDCGYEQ